MSAEWANAYEAPTSLDGGRLIGAHDRRATLWTMAWVGIDIVLFVLAVFAQQPWFVLPMGLVCLLGRFMAHPLGQRMPEYWFKAWLRDKRMPRVLHQPAIARDVQREVCRAVVEVETLNLRMSDEDTLGSNVKRLHAFYISLRFPVQIVVRAWQCGQNVDRRWFIAFTAPTPEVLAERARDIENSLTRAGLAGHTLNGNLYDTLQVCWTARTRGEELGPYEMHRERNYVTTDGEYVRGLLLTKTPKTIDANWLAGVIDGELAVDFSLWLDPLDNASELQSLADRMNEWETAQQLNLGVNGTNGLLGYRDPDLDDQINDAKRTRLLLRRRQLRVFLATVGFVVRGETLAAMQERERLLVDLLREHVGDDPVLPMDFEQDRAPLLAVPLGQPPIELPLRLVSPALARTYPFSNSNVTMLGGVRCGTSIGSRRENSLNLFSLPSPHMVIPAMTGAGKGFWVKCFLWRLLHAYSWDDAIRAWIIQSEKAEYNALVDSCGASIAETVALRTLEEVDAQCFTWNMTLRPWRQLTLFDITRMDAELRGKAIAKLLLMMERTMAWNRRPKRAVCVIDELGIVLRDDDALKAIDTAYRRFRSIPRDENPQEVMRIAMIGLTQRPSDLLANPKTRVLADLAETHLYLRQKAQEIRTVKTQLHLSDDEVTFLETCENGEALLICGRNRVGLKLDATEQEKEFAYT
jgi:hypothetical protein